MGILDEAIKEHLDLKRQHGAEDSEVKRLEDEAFGPPTRPGEPDFPESQEQPVVADDGPGGDTSPEAKGGEPGGEPEAATTLLEPEGTRPAPADPQPEGETSPAEQTPAPEPPAMEHGAVEAEPEAAAPEAPAPADAEPATEEGSGQDSASLEQPPGFFDQEAGELDLDLDLGDEAGDDLVTDAGVVEGERSGVHEAEPEAPSEEHPVEAEPPSEERPAEGMETVEHPMEEELGLEPPSEEQPATDEEAERESEEVPAGDSEDEGTGEGDVLEETPEFLQDRPEDDELWFEQGKPKDFDF